MSSKSLTSHLTSLRTARPYSSATRHPFLTAAGTRTLPAARLSLWLSQDRIYAAHAYPRFIGSLISHIPFSRTHALASVAEARNQRILRTLVYALENIVREVGFFSETAERWGLELEGWQERKGTRDYTAEMVRVVGGGQGIEAGIIFLWAMEKVYLDAWTYVRDTLEQQTASTTPPHDVDAAVSSFAKNWSNHEFIKFVDDLAALVNDLGIEPGTEAWRQAEGVWERVVELEEGFWPAEKEEEEMRIVIE